jgi:hypothetical protein
MSITYKYEIISVDAAARCMEVVYSAEGHQTMHIGARLPYDDETLEQVIRMYAPTMFWSSVLRGVIVPVVGDTGVIEPDLEQATPTWTQPTTIGSQTL